MGASFESDAEAQRGHLSLDFSNHVETGVLDVVVIGSGYGASMAAATLAGATNEHGQAVQMVVLERGKEYLPGDFPSLLDELPAHVRFSGDGKPPLGRRDGLFDLRGGPDVSALVANGLGGGSLINGAVLYRPQWNAFDSRLPSSVVRDLERSHLSRSLELLGGTTVDQNGTVVPNTIDQHAAISNGGPLRKTRWLSALAGGEVASVAPPITIQMAGRPALSPETTLRACTLCGDCMTGCNVGARASLDTHLLARAQRRGATVYTCATVIRLSRGEGLWHIDVVHTDANVQSRRHGPVTLRARRVIVAAGTLGSTELLLRSSRPPKTSGRPPLRFSSRLGQQFSANGDNMAALTCKEPVQACGDEAQPLEGTDRGVSPRRVGPLITRALAFGRDASGPGFLVQEFAVPAALRVLFEEIVTTRQGLDSLLQQDRERHHPLRPGQCDPLGVDPDRMARTMLVGVIGHDAAQGTLRLPPEAPEHEGGLQIRWPGVGRDAAMRSAYRRLEAHLQARPETVQHMTANPVWSPLPKGLEMLLDEAPGAVITTHPLGGCAMGASVATGVVNEWGEVWNAAPDASTDDWGGSLLVLDGSIVPGSLGANPALTIAALSLRAAERALHQWGWVPWQDTVPTEARDRGRTRPLADCTLPQPPAETEVQLVERLTSQGLRAETPQGDKALVVEITLAFEPVSLASLTTLGHKRLDLDARAREAHACSNTLRLFRQEDWDQHALRLADDATRQRHAVVIAHIRGSMDLLEREASWPHQRALRALWAYLCNRGGRDIASRLRRELALSAEPEASHAPTTRPGIRNYLALATQCGEARIMRYRVKVAQVEREAPGWEGVVAPGDPIDGSKRLVYAAGENLWNQLLYLNLESLGQWVLCPGTDGQAPRLKLDARFLAQKGIPLVRITRQENQVRALTDLARFAMYGLRLLVKIHAGSFRQPDPPQGLPELLPRAVSGLPAPEITSLDMDSGAVQPGPARVRLTRYANRDARPRRPPLVLIHGYSASGTGFAHDALEPGMARHFWRLGCDVWVLDLRTSAGMPDAQQPWAFEDVAWADIPLALCHIADRVAAERGEHVQLDLFAHCVGAVMTSMALLCDPDRLPSRAGAPRRYPDQLKRLKGLLRRIVLSQKGFVVEYTDANILRAYLLNVFKGLLTDGYRFRPSRRPRLGERLMDAFLDALPYPHEEWEREHPMFRRVPWGATRRRMDALYERTFNILNVPPAVLNRIDDFFGPLNLETVSQVIQFARFGTIATRDGHNEFVSLQRLARQWPQGGTLLVSARHNGMVDPHTTVTMKALLDRAGIAAQRLEIDGGHQDGLIGRADVAARLLREMEVFLR
jgi:cholesterol oxidase